MKILVIGGDSKLSKFLKAKLTANNYEVISTTRRENLNENELYLDFNNADNFNIPKNLTNAIVVGGITSYDDCDGKYEYAYKINCIKIPKLIFKFLQKKIRITFLSTNTVFTSEKNFPKEYSSHNPSFSYAKLKSITEKKICKIADDLNVKEYLSILRLTKNICENTPPFDNWIKHINENKKFYAFKDLFFSPITFVDSSKAILSIVKNEISGNFHLSGEKDINYSEFAHGLLDYFNKDKEMLLSVNSSEIGVNLKYNHHITGLNMDETERLLKIKPIKIQSIYKYFDKFIIN